MRKQLFRSALVVVGLTVGGSCAWADNSATITLIGTVQDRCLITLDPSGSEQNFDLTVDVADQAIADIMVDCNSPDGFSAEIQTSNGDTSGLFVLNLGGDLQAGTSTTELEYTLKIDGSIVNFVGGIADIPGVSTNPGGIQTVEATVSYTGNPGLDAGTYQDNLVFSITAN